MKKSEVTLLPRLVRAAPVVETSINDADRSVRIAWATDRPVWRPGYYLDLPGVDAFYEILSMDPQHIRMERFTIGLSVLDSHNWGSCDNVVGIATDPTFPEPGHESQCLVTFSPNREKAVQIFNDVKGGFLRGWSFGYDVYEFVRLPEDIDGLPAFLAVDWEPNEISVVPVPADPGAGQRADTGVKHKCRISWRKDQMDEDEEEEEKKKSAKQDDEEEEEEKSDPPEEDVDEDEPEKGKKTAGKKNQESMTAAERRRIAAAERTRIKEIRSAAAVFSSIVTEDDVSGFIDSGEAVDSVRAKLIERAQENPVSISPVSHLEMGATSTEKRRELMSRAILNRANPRKYPLRGERGESGERDPAMEFRGMTLLDMAKECLSAAGFNYRGYSPSETAKLALGMRVRDKHATTDFPILMSATVRDVLRDAYQLAAQTYQSFCRGTSAKDFKDKNLIQIGDVSAFRKILEGGEYPRATFGEAKESYRVEKYGQLIAITWESIINDELDAFSRLPVSIANESAQLCSDIVYKILLDNPKMGDGKPLFHADHHNIGAAADIDLAGMDAAFTAIGTQTNMAKRQLNLQPEHLIVGHNKRTKALQYLNDTVVPTKDVDVVPSQMRQLSPIVEGRITGNKWFLACSPGIIDTIEYAFLEGEEGLFTEERWGFEVDGLEIKARTVFGAKAIDWRGLYYNPGVA